MPAGGGINQLRRDPYLVFGLTYAAFQHVPHAHLPTDVLYLDGFALVRERRVAGDDKEAGDAGEVAGEVFSDAVAEIVLFRIVAHVGEGQDDDGGFVGQRQGLGAGC